MVTGGAGFIGSHLCERLLELSHSVICLDNFSTGRKENLRKYIDHDRFSVVGHDTCEPIDIEVDEIYNLACPASPIHYQTDPLKTTRTSVLGAINLLDLADRQKARILQASTSEVYGDPLVHPQTEKYNGNVSLTGLRACYDEGKRCAETLFYNYKRQQNVSIRIARIFNTYGPRMLPDDGRVISNFVHQALYGEPLTIYGDGSQTRSFCYVDDIVEGLIALMEHHDDEIGPINLGNPHEISILELAEQAIKMTNSTSQVTFHPLPEDDPLRRCPEIRLAIRVLGWSPKIVLHEGLERTIAAFRLGCFPS